MRGLNSRQGTTLTLQSDKPLEGSTNWEFQELLLVIQGKLQGLLTGGKKQNFLLSHVWRFNYVIKRLKEVAEEYGIKVLLVGEVFTSQTCPLCGQRHANGRIFRGLFKCRREGVVMNADLVGAFNILRKVVKKITPSLLALAGGRVIG